MGMYDTINDEQVKVFYVPTIGMPDLYGRNKSCIGYSGGSLSYFDKGDEVPYATYWYYLGEDFNIIDFFPYGRDNGPIIHIIRGGKNMGCKNLSNTDESIFGVPCYDDHGNKVKITSKNDVYLFIKLNEDIRDARSKFKRDADRKYVEYIRNINKEKNEELHKELYYQKEKEDMENKKTIKGIQEKINAFFEEDPLSNEYSEFGALVECLSRPYFEDLLIPGKKAHINDDRLVFLVGYSRLRSIIEGKDTFKDEYFEKFHFKSVQKRDFIGKCNIIHERYEKIKDLVFTKNQIDEQYLLRDILSGRYRKYYLEYNIVPFEGFDYDEWKYIKEDADEHYKNFCEELDEYVKKRFKEEGIEI